MAKPSRLLCSIGLVADAVIGAVGFARRDYLKLLFDPVTVKSPDPAALADVLAFTHTPRVQP